MNTTPPTEEKEEQKAYAELVNLQSVLSEAQARLDELQNGVQMQYIDLVDSRKKDYAKLQAAIATATEGIEFLATVNPQWFEKARTLKTPYGTVSFRRTSKLEVKNEELSIALLEQITEDAEPFITITKTLNLEALEKLDDEELARLKIRRVTTDSCTVKPAKVDLGKAVKAAEKKGGSK